MRDLILVAVGGATGSLIRWKLSQLNILNFGKFPINTFLANIIATGLLGVLVFSLVKQNYISKEIKLLVAVGFCGGLSTFSTFSLEIVELIKSGDYWQAIIYPVLSLIGGLILLGIIAKWS